MTFVGRPPSPAGSAPLVIGLVNNITPAPARTTERQFSRWLAAAAQAAGTSIELRYFTLADPANLDAIGTATPGLPAYGDLAALQSSRLDGLVVTGARPTRPDLRDEPIWPRLVAVIELASIRALPTIWSCLSAHAVALHLHGICRRALPQKLSGLVECTGAATGHSMIAGTPPSWRVPHSRYNELPEHGLAAAGYEILSRLPASGVDSCILYDPAPFVLVQGHPEYAASTLLREYYRDVGEFLCGLRDDYPAIPTNYLSRPARALLEQFRQRAIREHDPNLLSSFPLAACAQGLHATWQDVAARLGANWLAEVHARRMQQNARSSRAIGPRHRQLEPFARPFHPVS